ncbi:hypothetical protein [Rugosimonospora africana]|uniref:Uncharacterized protein n=1 Tax=Rugosimonospora africana TaxID=556532 RepID=A0A8J3QTX3_9ACTN|nr:hypothetical protein [Rugosimonospora africana]GIH16396.1 hypothetical protein Raf01_45680 [Rugosimonospora africana]
MSQPEESKAKTASTDDVLLRTAKEGAREPDEALRPPEEELPEEERRHSKPQHKLTG